MSYTDTAKKLLREAGIEEGGSQPWDITVNDPKFYHRLAADGPLGLGETYEKGYWDALAVDEAYARLLGTGTAAQRRTRIAPILKYLAKEKLSNPQLGLGAFEVGEKHYDLGNDLFEKMLGPTMTYTSGYWREADNLDDAQRAKLDLVCRKLKLEKGMTLLDIGCGWGNLAKVAAENYGARVTGITVAKEQAAFAREACTGLPVEIILEDYHDLEGQFDRVVSIEMIEAVGPKNLDGYFDVVHRCLKPGGLFVLESITGETFSRKSKLYLDLSLLWLVSYIFPNGYLPKEQELAKPVRDLFILHDWHGFGPDYDKTLMAWMQNFHQGWDELRAEYGDSFRRRWDWYLCMCAALFRVGWVNVHQIVYSKGPVPGGYRSVR